MIYEAHVRGLTMRHPDVPAEQRGTYAGLAHPAVIEHLTRLGRHRRGADAGAPVRARARAGRARADQLLGLQHDRLPRPAQRLRPLGGQRGEQVAEFKAMVKALHEAGIEVILDVVYNHTAEGDHLGPDAVASAASTTPPTTGCTTTTGATTSTTPAAATASTCATRTRCS